MNNFNENDHPRDRDGKFTNTTGGSGSDDVKEQIAWARRNEIDLPLNAGGSLDTFKLGKMYNERDESADSLQDDDVPKFGSQEELDALLGEEFKGVKGQAAIDKLLEEKRGHVKGAFHRDDIGDIDIFWGNDGAGLKHIIIQRAKEKPEHVEEILSHLNTAVNEGVFDKRNKYGNFELEYNCDGVKYRIIIAPEYHRNKITYVLSAFRRGKK